MYHLDKIVYKQVLLDMLILPTISNLLCVWVTGADLCALCQQDLFLLVMAMQTLAGDKNEGGERGMGIYSLSSFFAGSLKVAWGSQPKANISVT
jgi:hypothetical protein